jgi:DNA-binding transcriptional ArsR family regulator
VNAEQIATVGNALGAEARAAIVASLMGGTAHTGIELSRHCGLARSTVSEHLGVLVDSGLVTVEAQGRHRYFRLRSAEVAELIEALGEALPPPISPARSIPAGLAHARSCYDHLAGTLGVRLFDALLARGWLLSDDGGLALADAGRSGLDELGVEWFGSSRPALRRCVDWSERRTHLGGAVGAALLDHMLSERWLRRGAPQRRVLEVTRLGRSELVRRLGVEVS